MRTLLAAAMFVGMGLAGLSSSQAMSAPGMVLPQSGAITQVAGGCGPGGFRDRFGVCRPKGYVYRPHVRRCPPRMHWTPVGCRWN
jgi:hypothetical protein